MIITLSEAIEFLRRARKTGGLVEVEILENCIRESLLDGEILVTIKI